MDLAPVAWLMAAESVLLPDVNEVGLLDTERRCLSPH